MQFEIKNRWTGRVQFTAEIECSEGAPRGVKVGLAVKWAMRNDAVLRGAVLRGAVLRDADLRGAVLRGAVLRGAVLRDADLRGAVLRDADLSGAVLRDADLSDADLRDAVLRGAVLRGAVLRDADLRGAVLRDADLSGAVLRDADLRGAVLRDADLSGAVLRDADLSDADWIPKIESIHQTVYNSARKEGALYMPSVHQNGFCGTVHCRAGWVIHHAGQPGRVMEGLLGFSAAAALIYMASDPGLEKVPDFSGHLDPDDVLADMKRLAEQEAAR